MAAFWIISFSRNVAGLIIAAVFAAFGFGTIQPTVQALSMRRVPQARRGAGANTNYIFTDLGAIGGSYRASADGQPGPVIKRAIKICGLTDTGRGEVRRIG